MGLGPGVPGSIPSSGKSFVFRDTLVGFGSRRYIKKPTYGVAFFMGHAGSSKKFPNDASWENLSLGLSRPFSAPLLTMARAPAPLLTVARAPTGYLHHS